MQLKYGKLNNKHTVEVKSRTQRIEQLKRMYKKGMVERNDLTEDEEVLEGVDQLVQWTQTLDEQLLNVV